MILASAVAVVALLVALEVPLVVVAVLAEVALVADLVAVARYAVLAEGSIAPKTKFSSEDCQLNVPMPISGEHLKDSEM